MTSNADAPFVIVDPSRATRRRRSSTSNQSITSGGLQSQPQSRRTSTFAASVDTAGSSVPDEGPRPETAIQRLRREFLALERKTGLDVAANANDFIKNFSPNQLAELSAELFSMISDAVQQSEEDGDDSDGSDGSEGVFALGAPQLSIEVTTPTARNIELQLALPLPAVKGGDLELENRSSSDDDEAELIHSNRSEVRMSHSARSSVSVDGYEKINDYMIIDQIGKGQCGKVVLAVKDGEKDPVAIKIIPRRNLVRTGGCAVSSDPNQRRVPMNVLRSLVDDDDGGEADRNNDNDVDMDALMQEVAIMKKLRHKNIVSLFEVIDDPEEGNLYLVMQYCERGPLLSFDRHGKCEVVEQTKARQYFKQLVSGLTYLEKCNVLHLDIKPDNILLSNEDIVYLADFGMSEMIDQSITSPSHLGAMRIASTPDPDGSISSRSGGRRSPSMPRSSSPGLGGGPPQQKGTPAFMSPEMCRGDGNYTSATDVWSLGVTLYCMLFGKLPFPGRTWSEVTNKILYAEPEIPVDTEPAWTDILMGMLHKDPDERITLVALRHHPFLRDRSDSMGRGGFAAGSPASARLHLTPLTPMDVSFEVSPSDLQFALTQRHNRSRHHDPSARKVAQMALATASNGSNSPGTARFAGSAAMSARSLRSQSSTQSRLSPHFAS